MKRCFAILCLLVVLMNCAVPALAADGKVTYSGDSGKFIFAPGSKYSPRDLFPNYKYVMPGDRLTQAITVENKASNKVKVEIYMRALGAKEGSEEFLSQMHLTVKKSPNNTMAYMFDAAADETAQLKDWVKLGTLYSGGKVNLEVVLTVPVEMDNRYQEQIGYLDWEFMVKEYKIDPSDPEPPKTGDDFAMLMWVGMMVMSLGAILILLPVWKKKEKE